MNKRTKTITTISMLCALAYIAVAVGRIPLVLFLKYDPKDVIIAIGGLLFGPMISFVVAFVVSFIQMITISENGLIGFLMNVISSSSFACTAAWIYKKRRRVSGALLGLFCGWGCMIIVMLLWNYIMTPLYMGCSRQEVIELLLPAFLPFNLVKGGLNMAITMILYKPIVTALRRAHLIETKSESTFRVQWGIILVVCAVGASCILLVLALKGFF